MEARLPSLINNKSKPGELSNEGYKAALHAYLKMFPLSTVTFCTIARWMYALGYKYATRHKRYYVDGHEKEDIVKYRNEFLKRYLEYELQAHRWRQLTYKQAQVLHQQGKLKFHEGYRYQVDGVDMELILDVLTTIRRRHPNCCGKYDYVQSLLESEFIGRTYNDTTYEKSTFWKRNFAKSTYCREVL